MAKYAVIENGVVVNTVLADSEEFASAQGWVACEDSVKINDTYADETFTSVSNEETKTPEELLQRLKETRNYMLTKSDWTQGNDSPLTDEKKTEWATYRQAVRDITDSATSLDDVTWPTKPE